MKNLTKLDLTDNEVNKAEDYQEKVMAALKRNSTDPEIRIILDGHDEDNISVSDDSEDDDDEMDEEGEMEMMDNELFANMDEETRIKFQNGEISLEELEKMGMVAFDDDGEEGEAEQSDEESEGGDKKQKTDE